MEAIEGTFVDRHISDPTDLTFLTERLRELPEEARKYLTWAALFGETCVDLHLYFSGSAFIVIQGLK